MKKALTSLFFILHLALTAQIEAPEIYFDIGAYYEEEFEPSPNSYYAVGAGIELFSYKFFAPEIEITYYGGGDLSESYDTNLDTGTTTGWGRSTSMHCSVLSFSPKIFYGERGSRLVLIPEYNIANIRTKGVYNEISQASITKYARAKTYYWSCSLGFELDGWSENIRAGLYLNYSALDAGKALNQLDFSAHGISPYNYNTKTIGISFRVMYNFKRKS